MVSAPSRVGGLESWQESHLGEAAAILQAAYIGSIEAEISLYIAAWMAAVPYR
jgi:hypothetical protein